MGIFKDSSNYENIKAQIEDLIKSKEIEALLAELLEIFKDSSNYENIKAQIEDLIKSKEIEELLG